MTINIRGRYNEGYEDGYKNGTEDTKNKVIILINKIDFDESYTENEIERIIDVLYEIKKKIKDLK